LHHFLCVLCASAVEEYKRILKFTAETRRAQRKMRINDLTREVIGAAIEIHRTLGPGLLESAYEECFCHELQLRNLNFERQKLLPVYLKK